MEQLYYFKRTAINVCEYFRVFVDSLEQKIVLIPFPNYKNNYK